MTTLLKPFKACIIRGCSSFNQKYNYTVCKGKKNYSEGNAPLVWCAVDAEIGVELMRMVQCKSYYQWGVRCEEKFVWPQTRVTFKHCWWIKYCYYFAGKCTNILNYYSCLKVSRVWVLSSRGWSILRDQQLIQLIHTHCRLLQHHTHCRLHQGNHNLLSFCCRL